MAKPENVKCPDCGGPMVSRKSQFGTFWGCLNYPECKGTRDSEGRSKADREEYKRQRAEQKEAGKETDWAKYPSERKEKSWVVN